jgi:hypothetical protein
VFDCGDVLVVSLLPARVTQPNVVWNLWLLLVHVTGLALSSDGRLVRSTGRLNLGWRGGGSKGMV